jgi:hypothetical protein
MFHPFPRLPYELRAQIWDMTVEPRTVEVHIGHAYPNPHCYIISSTPIPATLQTCREARNHGLYQKTFTGLDTRPGNEGRYIWLNLNIDMVSIGPCRFDYYEKVAPTIKRLKFEREHTDESFFHWEGQDMKLFTNVEEIHVVCKGGFWNWGDATYQYPWPCAIENLTFIDGHRIARGLELEAIYREMLHEARLANDGVAWDSDDSSSWPE